MPKYISLDAIKKDIAFLRENGCTSLDLREIEERMEYAVPAAEVDLVVHGVPVLRNRPSRDERYEAVKLEDGEILYRKYVYVDETDWAEYCSACGKRLCSRFNNYCPNCGAKMDGGKND